MSRANEIVSLPRSETTVSNGIYLRNIIYTKLIPYTKMLCIFLCRSHCSRCYLQRAKVHGKRGTCWKLLSTVFYLIQQNSNSSSNCKSATIIYILASGKHSFSRVGCKATTTNSANCVHCSNQSICMCPCRPRPAAPLSLSHARCIMSGTVEQCRFECGPSWVGRSEQLFVQCGRVGIVGVIGVEWCAAECAVFLVVPGLINQSTRGAETVSTLTSDCTTNVLCDDCLCVC